jgi:hypothetical protein
MPAAKKKEPSKKGIDDDEKLDEAYKGSIEKAKCFSPKSKVGENQSKKK